MKKLFVLSGLIVALSCSVAFAEQTGLTISAGRGTMSGSLNVAAAKGFFEQFGVTANVNSYKKGKVAFEKYLSGEDDYATTNIISIVLTDFDITKHRIIAAISYSDNQTKILARKSAGITKPAHLRGKKAAAIPITTSHFYLSRFLEVNGISNGEAEIILGSKKEVTKLMADGEVDAVCLPEIDFGKVKKVIGDDYVVFHDPNIYRKSVQLLARVDTIANNPQQIEGILRGAHRADAFIKKNIDEAVRIIAKDKGYPLPIVDKAVRNEIFYDLSLKQTLLSSLENMEMWAIKNKLVKRTVPRNYLELIDYGPLEKIDANLVTIIR